MPNSETPYFLIVLGIFVVLAAVLLAMGQPAICECGFVKFWHGVVFSSENSQHASDWYTFSHVIHGFGFYFLLWLINKRFPMPLGLRLALAVGLEVGWEIFENTDFIIKRYRETTISLDYYGDSVINSASDVAAMILGFWLAWRLPVWLTITLAVALEVFVGFFIRDNLLLNIIMLIYPLEAIKIWQGGPP